MNRKKTWKFTSHISKNTEWHIPEILIFPPPITWDELGNTRRLQKEMAKKDAS